MKKCKRGAAKARSSSIKEKCHANRTFLNSQTIIGHLIRAMLFAHTFYLHVEYCILLSLVVWPNASTSNPIKQNRQSVSPSLFLFFFRALLRLVRWGCVVRVCVCVSATWQRKNHTERKYTEKKRHRYQKCESS